MLQNLPTISLFSVFKVKHAKDLQRKKEMLEMFPKKI
jgi:hypothetical protein